MTQIPFQINVGEEILQNALARKMLDGELGDQIAQKLAEMQAEVMTFNRTQAAQLLNKSRPTVNKLEKAGKLKFAKDDTISLKALLDYRRAEAETDSDEPKEIERRPAAKKRRTFR